MILSPRENDVTSEKELDPTMKRLTPLRVNVVVIPPTLSPITTL